MIVRYGILTALACAGVADARLTRLTIESRTSAPAMAGAVPYEILRGHYEGEIDPADPHNRIITDLVSAPRTPRGMVAYRATFAISRPIDATQASGVLMYDVPNRGNGSVAADRDRHVRVISGWQGDLTPLPGAQTIEVPVAAGLTGAVVQRFVGIAPGTTSVKITGSIGRPTPRPLPISLDTRRAALWIQSSDRDTPQIVPPGDWAFADCSIKPFPGTPSGSHLCVRSGFAADRAYTLRYTGKDPQVLGTGFAAVRDLVAFLRSATRDSSGTSNPVAGIARWAIITGTSQSGNFVKSFVNLGFNADEQGRRVFDGANPDIAARQVQLNIRFGVPGGAADLFELGSEGTLWWSRYKDRMRARGTSSLLDRCHASNTCPKIVETFGAAEFWGLRMSPGLVGTDARRDLPLPPEVRRYYFPGVTHGGSRAGGFPLNGEPGGPGYPSCALAFNPTKSADTRRALLARLVAWVKDGVAPPDSRYPTIARGELVPPRAQKMRWPAIPGVPGPDAAMNTMLDYDVGPAFDYRDESGVATLQPPRIRRTIPSLVPAVDADGNEKGGIASVQLLVPIGTYTGWNIKTSGYGAGGSCGFIGGFVPFARTHSERETRHDPRLSLEERYGSHDGFVTRVRTVAADQVRQGWLMADDAAAIVAQAEASDVLR